MHDATPESRALTWKSIGLGILLVLIATIGGFYARHVLHTSRLAQNHLSLAVVFPFILTVLFLRRPLRLSRGELLVIFCMGLIASTLPTYFLSKLLANLVVPYYMADPTNGWAEYTHGFIPAWSVIKPGAALTWFFEGLPKGASIPWGVWFAPLFWWVSLIAAFCAVMLSTVVILRKPWIEYERIDYPLMELPLAMVDEMTEGSRFPEFMRTPVFWFGFSVAILGILWNIAAYFNPNLPVYPWQYGRVSLGREFQAIRLSVFWPIIGFAYFIKLDVGFSIWFFYLLGVIEEGLFNRVGLEVKEPDPYGTSFAAVGWQTFGVWVVLVGWGLWIARPHLADVWRKAVHGDKAVDDSGEILSYRSAVLAFVLGMIYMAGWLFASGMPAWVVGVFLLVMMVIFLGITRIVAEAGLITIRAPIVSQHFIVFAFGTASLPGATMTALAMSYGWYGDLKTTLMPALAHTIKLTHTVKTQKRTLLWAILLAITVGVLVSIWYIIYMAYHTGAGNYGGQLAGDLARLPWDLATRYSRTPVAVDTSKLAFMAIGMGITVALYMLRSRYPGWPLHPLGLAAGPTYPVTNVVFSLFLGWVAKSLILRFGGSGAYRLARPFFLGLIMGHYVGAGLSFFVDMIWFPGHGHGIPISD
jgi:hypothetical protein